LTKNTSETADTININTVNIIKGVYDHIVSNYDSFIRDMNELFKDGTLVAKFALSENGFEDNKETLKKRFKGTKWVVPNIAPPVAPSKSKEVLELEKNIKDARNNKTEKNKEINSLFESSVIVDGTFRVKTEETFAEIKSAGQTILDIIIGTGGASKDDIIHKLIEMKSNASRYEQIFKKFNTVEEITGPYNKQMALVQYNICNATKMILMHLVTGQAIKKDMVAGTCNLVQIMYDATNIQVASSKK